MSALFEPLNLWAETNEATLIQDPEQYAVYSALLNPQYTSAKLQQFVINSATTSRKEQAFIGIRGGLAPSGAKRPETDANTTSDFDSKNDKSYLLERRFDLKTRYVLVTSDELHAFFVQDAGGHYDMRSWTRFYKQYPDALSILALSRVGLSSGKDQALVYVAIQHDFLGGSGRFFVLSKGDKAWEVQRQVMIWLS